jgi:hypothetical protein
LRGLLVALVLVAACQSTPPDLIRLTTGIRQRYKITEPELRTLQYYISERVVLERTAVRGTHSVKRGKLIDRHGTLIQRVVIEYGTPGIIEPDSLVGSAEPGQSIEVSFARGAALSFSARRADGSYSLAGAKTGGLLEELFSGWGMRRTLWVMFDGSSWKAVAGKGTRLQIERTALGHLVRQKRVLPGLTLPDVR